MAEALAPQFEGFADVEYPDWSRLFERLAREAERTGVQGPIVIDELPYLVVSSPELPSILQRFIDHQAKRAKLVIALAGSSQRMMQDLVLGSSSLLYGRAREAFEVRPLPPRLLRSALGLRDDVAVVQAWSLWGTRPSPTARTRSRPRSERSPPRPERRPQPATIPTKRSRKNAAPIAPIA
jgi:hypothetical protein